MRTPIVQTKIEKDQVWEHRAQGHYVIVLHAEGDHANIATADVHGGTVVRWEGRRTVTTRYLRRAYRLPDRLETTW